MCYCTRLSLNFAFIDFTWENFSFHTQQSTLTFPSLSLTLFSDYIVYIKRRKKKEVERKLNLGKDKAIWLQSLWSLMWFFMLFNFCAKKEKIRRKFKVA